MTVRLGWDYAYELAGRDYSRNLGVGTRPTEAQDRLLDASNAAR